MLGLLILLPLLAQPDLNLACTNLIVGKGASADGSTLFSYTADGGFLFGTLGHLPAGLHPAGTKRKTYALDDGKYLGEIDEASETYNVIGNLNEHGVAIGETTFGGNETLAGGEGLLDYESLILVTLQRVKTAREAIAMFGHLVEKYGYAATGESFTIGDPNEVWVLELIGKGKFEKGAVWVAVRIPDDHVSGHANQARIQRFPLNDPDTCLYAKDVIDFAIKVGLWDATRPREEFNFAEAYDPITFAGARLSDARVWSFFSKVSKDLAFEKAYEAYVLGERINAESRMPLSIPVRSKISATDLMMHMRNHYEGTVLDPRNDVGAESSGSPFRVRPVAWKFENRSYVNERTVGTQQATWNFVAQLRGNVPAPFSILWFGVDDATFSVHIPFYGGVTRVPHAFADGNGDLLTWSSDAAFWAFNTVANFIYPRWFIAPSVIARAHEKELGFAAALKDEEEEALRLYKVNHTKAMDYVTDIAVERAEKVAKDEFALFGELMVTYRDGFKVTSLGPDAPNHGGAQGGVMPNVEEVGLPASWYKRIVEDTGDHYRMSDNHGQPDLLAAKLRTLNKGILPAPEPESGAVEAPLIV